MKHNLSNGTFPLHGTARYGSVRFTFGGFSTRYSTWYLVLFLVPPRPRFQANRTITKTWRVNSADHWLAGENCHRTCGTRHNRPAGFKSAQSAKDRIERNCFEWAHLSFVSLSEEVQTVLSLIAEERIQRELDGASRNEKVFQESRQ